MTIYSASPLLHPILWDSIKVQNTVINYYNFFNYFSVSSVH